MGPRAGVHSLFILVRQSFNFLLPSYQRYTKLAVLNVLCLSLSLPFQPKFGTVIQKYCFLTTTHSSHFDGELTVS